METGAQLARNRSAGQRPAPELATTFRPPGKCTQQTGRGAVAPISEISGTPRAPRPETTTVRREIPRDDRQENGVGELLRPQQDLEGGGPYPHVLVLLSEYPEVREYAPAHHELLSQYAERLGVIPEEWLHATVQGIHHAIDDSQTDKLRGTLHEELAGMQPFQVQLGPVWPGITAVTVAVYPEDGTAKLNGRVRAAMEKVPGIALRAPELRFWAHASLSYARQDFTDRKLNRALRALRPPRVDITIDRVHLVNQYQRPDLGYYTWDVVEEVQLG